MSVHPSAQRGNPWHKRMPRRWVSETRTAGEGPLSQLNYTASEMLEKLKSVATSGGEIDEPASAP